MKVIFLDRDGVINRYPGDRNYVTGVREFSFLPGALTALKKLTEDNFRIFVISNQAGVSKGIYTKNALKEITALMLSKVRTFGAQLTGVYYCIHREDDNCSCRKPKTGMIKKALHSLKGKPTSPVYFIGDSIMDVDTGKNAGFKTILVLSGKEKLKNQDRWQSQPDYVAKDLLAAIKIILHENPRRLRLGRSRTQKLR